MKERKSKIGVKLNSKKNEKVKFSDLEGHVVTKDTRYSKKEKKGSLKKHFRKYKKIYKLLALLVIIVALMCGLYIGIRNYVFYKKYGKYEKKMDNYGFSLMYNNQVAKSYQKVTKLEVVKLILSSIYNDDEMASRGFPPEGDYDGEEWIKAAKAFGIIAEDYITKDNYDDVATYKEALGIYLEARSRIMNINISSQKESSFKNLQSFSLNERGYINDAVENGLLKDSKKKLNIDKKLVKGQFNELIIKFVEKYNTVIPEGETLVTKEESKPSNYEKYPYILYSVDKEVYEYDDIKEIPEDYKTPVETYKYDKHYYDQMQYRTELYYNTILNVNYKNIDREKFLETINNYTRHNYEESINKYLDYVTSNKIIIEGKAKVQLPIFYLDGIRFRTRVKLEFEIKNAEQKKDLLFGDFERYQDVNYKKDKYVVYVDVPMGTTMLSKALLLDVVPVIDIMVNDTKASKLNEF